MWSGSTEVLLGVPAYDDAGVEYHSPKVENIENSLLGIHAGLAAFDNVPVNYRGICLYSEWEMDDDEWDRLSQGFERHR